MTFLEKLKKIRDSETSKDISITLGISSLLTYLHLCLMNEEGNYYLWASQLKEIGLFSSDIRIAIMIFIMTLPVSYVSVQKIFK